MTARRTLVEFCDALIVEGGKPGLGGGIRWEPFMRHDAVQAALEARGYELVIEGNPFHLRRRMYFAAPLTIQEWGACEHVRNQDRDATHTVDEDSGRTLRVCRACSRRFPKTQVSPLQLEVRHEARPT